jgi:Iap family predicted aminopeptidase
VVAFEDTESHQLAFSIHFSNRYNGSIDVAGLKDRVLYFAKFNPEAVELDLVIFAAKASKFMVVRDIYDQ